MRVVTSPPTSSSDPFEGRLPIGRFYLLCLATLGLWVPIWVRRRAQADGEGREDPARLWLWPIASLFTPLAMVLLFEFARSDREALRQHGSSAINPWGPALLHGAVLLLLLFAPEPTLWLPVWLLFPLPFVWVQHQRNRRIALAGEGDGPVGGRTRLQWATVACGLPLAAALAWWIDGDTLMVMASPAERVGALLTGAAGLYTVEAPRDGWRVVKSGTFGDDDSDIEIVAPSGDSWAVGYVVSGPDETLDSRVSVRRSAIRAEATLGNYKESRHFLPESDFIPMSLALYEQEALGVRRAYAVLTVELDEALIEIVGFTPAPGEQLGPLVELLESLRLSEGAAP